MCERIENIGIIKNKNTWEEFRDTKEKLVEILEQYKNERYNIAYINDLLADEIISSKEYSRIIKSLSEALNEKKIPLEELAIQLKELWENHNKLITILEKINNKNDITLFLFRTNRNDSVTLLQEVDESILITLFNTINIIVIIHILQVVDIWILVKWLQEHEETFINTLEKYSKKRKEEIFFRKINENMEKFLTSSPWKLKLFSL